MEMNTIYVVANDVPFMLARQTIISMVGLDERGKFVLPFGTHLFDKEHLLVQDDLNQVIPEEYVLHLPPQYRFKTVNRTDPNENKYSKDKMTQELIIGLDRWIIHTPELYGNDSMYMHLRIMEFDKFHERTVIRQKAYPNIGQLFNDRIYVDDIKEPMEMTKWAITFSGSVKFPDRI